jgi:hypothetical protein
VLLMLCMVCCVMVGTLALYYRSQGAYVWYYYTTVKRLSHMFKYYPKGILKSIGRQVLLIVRPLYYSQSAIILFVSGHPIGDHHTSALQTTAYIWSKNPVFQNALLADPSDLRFKLTL